MGLEVNDVFFTDRAVGRERLVGVEGQGWSQLIRGLNTERVIVGRWLWARPGVSTTRWRMSSGVSSSVDRLARSRRCRTRSRT